MSQNDRLPNSFWKLDAYTNGYQIVVLGSPPTDQDEGDPLFHSCDEMGCSSLEHVIARIPIMAPIPELTFAQPKPKIVVVHEESAEVTPADWDNWANLVLKRKP